MRDRSRENSAKLEKSALKNVYEKYNLHRIAGIPRRAANTVFNFSGTIDSEPSQMDSNAILELDGHRHEPGLTAFEAYVGRIGVKNAGTRNFAKHLKKLRKMKKNKRI